MSVPAQSCPSTEHPSSEHPSTEHPSTDHPSTGQAPAGRPVRLRPESAVATEVVGAAAFRETLSHFSAGVAVVTTRWRGISHAMTATAFCSVSLDPPLVLVSVSRTSRFHAAVLGAGRWAVSILAADQDALARHFSTPGRDLATQFDGLPHTPAPVTGSPVIDGSLAWLDCETDTVHEAGDHTLVVGLVLATGVAGDAGSEQSPTRPLTYYRSQYRGLD